MTGSGRRPKWLEEIQRSVRGEQEETWVAEALRDSPWSRKIPGSDVIEGVLLIAGAVVMFAVFGAGLWLF